MSTSAPDLMVGIAGGSCSGKTTLGEILQAKVGDDLATFPFDDLFVGIDAVAGQPILDWESPDLYRWDDYRRHIKSLRAGHEALVAALHPESIANGIHTKLVEPKPIVIVAGFLALHDTEVNTAFDTTLFIDLPEEEIVRRRLLRATPGYPWDDAEYITERLIDGHRKHVEPQRKSAEHIVDGTLSQDKLAEEVIRIIQATAPHEILSNR